MTLMVGGEFILRSDQLLNIGIHEAVLEACENEPTFLLALGQFLDGSDSRVTEVAS